MAEYTVSDDGLTYTFVLQDDLKWSDGEPITADDIVWNVETALKAAQVASAFTSCFGYIEGAAEYVAGEADSISGIAVDGNTITFTLTAPYAFFLKNLANFSFLPVQMKIRIRLSILRPSTAAKIMLSTSEGKVWNSSVTRMMKASTLPPK